MNHNKIFFILTTIILFLLVVVLGVTIQIKQYMITQPSNLKDECYVKEMIALQSIGESIRNSNKVIQVEKEFQEKIPLSDSPRLVLRYSSYACNICIEFAIEEIKKIFPDYASNSNILYLASEYKSKTKTDYPNGVNIGNSNLGLSLEDAKLPFYFILINGETYHIFIPDKSAPDQTKTYLQEIKKRYFDDVKK